jgi:hypothetical protein
MLTSHRTASEVIRQLLYIYQEGIHELVEGIGLRFNNRSAPSAYLYGRLVF